jgi:predicted PurR-regulated permease PerM
MQTSPSFNNKLKQIMILALLLVLVYLALKELYIFLPGLLGALTLYILSRASYFQLIYQRKWKKGGTALLYLFGYLILFGLIVYITFSLVEKRIHPFLTDPSSMLKKAEIAVFELQEKVGITFVSKQTLSNFQQRLTEFIPSLLNDTLNLISNIILMLFVFYYMLVNCKQIETYMSRVLPLKQNNIDMLASETKRLVRASALGIPIISIIQGATATLGYVIFGLEDYVIWGFLTGVFAFFPIVGTMIVWVPVVIYMYAAGDTLNATGLLFYSLIVTGNIDYLARITLLRRMGNVHPMVTVLGVIVGLGLFGFIGLIFGPLLVNYIILLFRIYNNEFLDEETNGELQDVAKSS